MIRECEVIFEGVVDGERLEVACGRIAVAEVHGWW